MSEQFTPGKLSTDVPRRSAQRNKATEYHLGLLKAKLARYRVQLLEPTSKSGKSGEGFDVQKSGG